MDGDGLGFVVDAAVVFAVVGEAARVTTESGGDSEDCDPQADAKETQAATTLVRRFYDRRHWRRLRKIPTHLHRRIAR